MKRDYAESALIFKALSDETRLRALHMLSSGELCACELLESFRITQPTLSYHMNILCNSGLVSARREGAWVKYSLNMERLQAARELLSSMIGSEPGKKRD
ncbi:MAG: Transcriptional repressor SdpR [Firmicutes bacterium ADurb.BinA052]|nr:winged helix-turn-helix transcriptional regulator [Bacillota bacterium]OPZ50202.1 MAG: Transcriptional repressor SdpR [Firmicutes bacterium ADurb.BinA052]